MAEPEPVPLIRRIPPLTWFGIAFIVLGLLTQDRWAFYAGGALLVFASLQWGRPAS